MLEVGLLLHFGREAKYSRVVYENRFKGSRNRKSGIEFVMAHRSRLRE